MNKLTLIVLVCCLCSLVTAAGKASKNKIFQMIAGLINCLLCIYVLFTLLR